MSTRKWNGSLGRRVFNAVQHLEDYHGITVPSYEHFDIVAESVRRRWQCLFDELNKRYRCGKTTVHVICQPGVFRVNFSVSNQRVFDTIKEHEPELHRVLNWRDAGVDCFCMAIPGVRNRHVPEPKDGLWFWGT
jgi:hypothetical protein